MRNPQKVSEFFRSEPAGGPGPDPPPRLDPPAVQIVKWQFGIWTRDAPGLCFDWGDAGNRLSVPIRGLDKDEHRGMDVAVSPALGLSRELALAAFPRWIR